MADLWRDFPSGPDPPEEVYVVMELTYFFENYKRAEGKITKVERWEDVGDAKKIITWAQGEYKEKA